MTAMTDDNRATIRRIASLPTDWHGSGTVSGAVMAALERHLAAHSGITRSVETGTGRTTLLFSHVSRDHTVFTADDTGDGDSLNAVRDSPLLNADNVHFIVGRTQITLRDHHFDAPVQAAFLDGPHAYPFPELEYWAVYPHIDSGGLLVVDDIHIRTVGNMFRFLRADDMWELIEVVDNTAFFRRTDAPTFSPLGDGWSTQGFNRRFSFSHLPVGSRMVSHAKARVPQKIRETVKRRLRRTR